MQIAAQLPFRNRAIDDLHELVRKVHQIVDRKPRVGAGSGQQLDKSAVLIIVGVIVASASKPAAAQPRRGCNVKQLVSALKRGSARMLVQVSPLPVLQESPAHQVKLSGSNRNCGKEVAPIS